MVGEKAMTVQSVARLLQHLIESRQMEVMLMSCISIRRLLEKRKRSLSVLIVSLCFGSASGAVSEAGGGGGLHAMLSMQTKER